MNLRVDLILETEQRSASPVSIAFVARISGITVAAALVLAGLYYGMEVKNTKDRLNLTEAALKETNAKHAEFQALTNILTHKRAVLAECEGWEKARIEWHEQFLSLRRLPPPTIQYTEVRIDLLNQMVDKKPARVFKMSLKGLATTSNAAEAVDRLRTDISTCGAFTSYHAQIDIPAGTFRAPNDPRSPKTDRLFEIACAYGARKFE